MKRTFGTLASGEAVDIYTLHSGEAVAEVTTYGATLVSFKPFGDVNIIGGYDELSSYVTDTSNQGAIIARVTNRIEDATITIDGAIYMLTANQNGNCLHGGMLINNQVWSVENATDSSITLSYYSPDGEEGFPHGLLIKVTYSLVGSALAISYKAYPEGKTPISMTNHAYFNLDGMGSDIKNHELKVYADSYTAVDQRLIPTGEHLSVVGTPYDFRSSRKIGEFIDDNLKGYDTNFIICPEIYKEFENKKLVLAAVATNGKITLKAYTDRPCIHLYTPVTMKSEPHFSGEVPRCALCGFCLEAQIEPNAVKHGVGLYDAGEVYTQLTVYEAEKVK
ncbi:MAG: galactose mutarotase [Clostridia bacterium]|nr:galactose mutarotase [Clostridia bacterium]